VARTQVHDSQTVIMQELEDISEGERAQLTIRQLD
jgi:hypothetical protein